MKLYKITEDEDEITETESVTPEDVILVLNEDNKSIYLYRGVKSISFNEWRSEIIYERILNKFFIPRIFLLHSLEEKEKEDKEIVQAKIFILEHFPNMHKFRLIYTLKNLFLLHRIRKNIKAFKNYEKSRVWRSRLSNTTNIWRLSILNVIVLLSTVFILFWKAINPGNMDFINFDNNSINLDSWQFWLENFQIIVGICAFLLLILLIVNLLFVLFPLRFPISPSKLKNMSKDSINSNIQPLSRNMNLKDSEKKAAIIVKDVENKEIAKKIKKKLSISKNSSESDNETPNKKKKKKKKKLGP